MKVSVAFVVLSAVFCIAAAVPLPAGRQQAGLMFIQQHHPQRYYPAQQAMLVHYNKPKYASRRSSQEVAAFAAGDSIEGGTFIQEDEAQPALQDGDALSVAEAYPESDDSPALLAADIPVEDEVYQPENEEYPLAQADPAPVVPQQDAPVDVAPVKKNKKKVAPAPVEAEDDDDEYVPAITKGGRPSAQQWPHTFFPMNFGKTSGGAIAVANSFSTGKGGTATSHATAYGAPAPSKKRRQD